MKIFAFILLLLCVPLQAESLKVLFLGDLLIAKGVQKKIEEQGIDYPYRKIKPLLDGCDVVFANLESPVTDRGTPFVGKPWVFRASTASAEFLGSLNISVVSLANNHLLDFGVVGMNDTIDFVHAKGIVCSGAGADEASARMPAVIYKNGYELVFLSYNERPPQNYFATAQSAGTSRYALDSVLEDVRRYKRADNFVFVSIHWGIEHSTQIREDQVLDAHRIIDAGADGIIGHHSHKAQGVELYRGKPIFYSLGNAVNGFYNETYTANIFGMIELKKGRIDSASVLPVEGDNAVMHFQPYPLEGDSFYRFIGDLMRLSAPLSTGIIIDGSRGFLYRTDLASQPAK